MFATYIFKLILSNAHRIIVWMRLFHVSAGGLIKITRVSVAAVTTDPDHFFTCFRQVSVEGNMWCRKCNFVLTGAETHGNVPEIWNFQISVDGIRPKRSRNYKVMPRKPVFAMFPLTFRSGNKFVILRSVRWGTSWGCSWI